MLLNSVSRNLRLHLLIIQLFVLDPVLVPHGICTADNTCCLSGFVGIIVLICWSPSIETRRFVRNEGSLRTQYAIVARAVTRPRELQVP